MSQCGYVHLKISPSRKNEQPWHHLKFCPLKGFPFITTLHSPWREGLLRVPQGGDQCCSDLLSGGTSILHRLICKFFFLHQQIARKLPHGRIWVQREKTTQQEKEPCKSESLTLFYFYLQALLEPNLTHKTSAWWRSATMHTQLSYLAA